MYYVKYEIMRARPVTSGVPGLSSHEAVVPETLGA
jgi:hypothetical protein